MNPSTPPKGSLEDLFRHHLLESEAAAVPPRPQVWEKLDNSLLLAQNKKYQQRLRVHRWAVAASLLLAMLAGGGWWHSQQQPPASLVQATQPKADAGQPGQGHPSLTGSAARFGQLTHEQAAVAATAVPAPIASNHNATAIDQTTTSPLTTYAPRAARPAARRHHSAAVAAVTTRHQRQLTGRTAATLLAAGYAAPTALASQQSAASTPAPAGQSLSSAGYAAIGQSTIASKETPGAATGYPAGAAMPLAAAVASTSPATRGAADAAGDMAVVAGAAANAAAASPGSLPVTAEATLASRQAQLALAPHPDLPTMLASLPQPQGPAPTITRNWQFGLTYATSAFQPNIDFSKDPGDYNPALGAKSASLTRVAAVEYRNNLHAGLGQRLGLWATRRLGNGRFGLRTGLEIAQNNARSATTLAFVGEQVPDLNYTMPAPLKTTNYRYRTASVPVELHYGNPLKAGWSFYSRLGGMLTALLNVRSEVEGNAEATRSYSLLSPSSPYRGLTGSVRGGAGVQYRPRGHQWALTLGPAAEAGIMSLNADPTQTFWSQQRPYSFGLEAGVELGRSPRLLLK